MGKAAEGWGEEPEKNRPGTRLFGGFPGSVLRKYDEIVYKSGPVLGLHQAHAAVFLPQLGLLDLAGGISRHVGEDDLPGALVPGQIGTVLVDLALGAGHARLHLDDGGGDLPQPVVGQADDGHVVDLGVGGQELKPSSSCLAMSPVWSQPSLSTSAVASGSW